MTSSNYEIKTHHVTVADTGTGQRLDKYLAGTITDLTRNRLQKLIAGGHLTLAGSTITDPSIRVKPGETYTLTVPPVREAEVAAVSIPLEVLYEDDDLLVIDKPAGMTVHPAPGHHDDTLVNALLAHCGEQLSGIGGVARPGIVHRLDKDTSGVMVVAKHDRAHQHLAKQLQERTLSREYLALVWGRPSPRKGKIEGNIGRSLRNRKKMAVLKQGGKEAVTHYECLESYGEGAVSFVRCRLETGRTHQIRVHMAHKGHPLLGDPLYGGGWRSKASRLPKPVKEALKALNGQALHAERLHFVHPVSAEAIDIMSEIPHNLDVLKNTLKNM